MTLAETIQQTIADRFANVQPGEETKAAFIECCKMIAADQIERTFYRAIIEPDLTGEEIYARLNAKTTVLIDEWKIMFATFGYDDSIIMPIAERATVDGAEERIVELVSRLHFEGQA